MHGIPSHSPNSTRSALRIPWLPGALISFAVVLQLGGCSSADLARLSDIFNGPSPKSEPGSPGAENAAWHRNITTTYFDITQYARPQTAWNDVDPLTENPYYLALPLNNRIPGFGHHGQCKNRWVEIVNADSGKRAYGQWEDVGPWFVNDAAYVFGQSRATRPFAEQHVGESWSIYRETSGSGVRRPRRVRNRAGIDLSPRLANAVGILW